MRRPERRSAVLARAQAHLAGRGVAAKGAQQQDWGPRPSSSSSRSHGHGLPALRMASDLSDLSDTSSSARPGGQKPVEGLILGETPPPSQPHSRFLKQKSQKGPEDVRPAGLDPAMGAGRGATPAARPSALLRKLAQIEDMIQSRKPRRDVAQTVPVPDDEISVSESICDSEQRAEGLKYLKRNARPQEAGARDPPPGKDAGSEERHGRGASMKSRERQGLSGFTLGGKVLSPSRPRPSLPAQSSLKTPPQRSPSPASSSALPPRDPSPPTSSRSLSPPEHSLIRSLDELFSEAGGTPREASGSSSSNFRVNVFSLEDLAPSAANQKEGLEAKATMVPVAGQPVTVLGAAPAPAVVAQSPFAAPKVSVGKAATQEEEEEDLGETEISERLSCSSAGPSTCEEEETPGSAECSEDFEPAASSAESEATRPPSSPERSSSSEASSLGSTRPPRRITMTDAAVQTNGSSLTYRWWQSTPVLGGRAGEMHTEAPLRAAGAGARFRPPVTKAFGVLAAGVPVTLGQVEGGSAIEEAPVASHVLSLDVVEALTTYSPAAFALNSLLEQNVQLIRQFVEASRRLHASFVASLEEENFHYHSLEEAKRHIDRHKPRPLTLEQASQRVEERRRRRE